MNENIAGFNVPRALIDEISPVPKGIEIAGRMLKWIHSENICDGGHIIAIGKKELVPEISSINVETSISEKS